MREFFRGWRRKAGLVTLAMALLLMVGWLRSLRIRDVYALKRNGSDYTFRSFEGGLGWQRVYPSSPNTWSGWRSDYDFKFDLFDPWHPFDSFDDVEWQWDWAGFSFGSASLKDPEFISGIELWIVPYWPLVPPLTLLSAWLILSKPRPAKSVKEFNSV